MISEHFKAGNISVMYDSNEGLYYLLVDGELTKDCTKEELVDLLKSLINSLREDVKQMNREAFEKIQHIKDNLEHFDIYYSSLGGYRYSKDDTPCFYLNGAWMMYQEQQKKIEDVLQQLDTLQEHYWGKWKEKADMMDQGYSVAYEHAYWMLKEVLR